MEIKRSQLFSSKIRLLLLFHIGSCLNVSAFQILSLMLLKMLLWKCIMKRIIRESFLIHLPSSKCQLKAKRLTDSAFLTFPPFPLMRSQYPPFRRRKKEKEEKNIEIYFFSYFYSSLQNIKAFLKLFLLFLLVSVIRSAALSFLCDSPCAVGCVWWWLGRAKYKLPNNPFVHTAHFHFSLPYTSVLRPHSFPKYLSWARWIHVCMWLSENVERGLV